MKEQHSQCGYIRVTEVGRVVVREVRKVAWESQITEGPSGLSKDSEFILGRRGLNKGQLCNLTYTLEGSLWLLFEKQQKWQGQASAMGGVEAGRPDWSLRQLSPGMK